MNESFSDFLEVYTKLESAVNSMSEIKGALFMDSLKELKLKRNRVICDNYRFLRDIAALRNMNIHLSGFPAQSIATPSQFTIDKIKNILYDLTQPDSIEHFARGTHIFSPEDKFADALKYMSEEEYSQIVVSTSERSVIVSSDGISNWLARSVAVDLVSIEDTLIQDVLECEPDFTFGLVKRNELLERCKEMFESAIHNKDQPRLHALLITNSGKAHEKVLGVITPWDVL